MRNNLLLPKIVVWGMLCFTALGFGQTKDQQRQIIKNYDLEKLKALQQEYKSWETTNKAEALRLAKLNNWPVYINEKGLVAELQGVRADGTPVYYAINDTDAIGSNRADFLHSGGALGLNVNGQNMTAYVWDGGPTRTTHEDYSGRVSVGDGNTTVTVNGGGDHAQHVTGIIIGAGLGNDNGKNSKGIAPQANAVTHEWTNDLSEATSAAASGMLLSNHSYGGRMSSTPDWAFGAYTTRSRAWDNLMYNAPYYLMITSAGNDGRNDNQLINGAQTGNGNPLEGNSAYDKLSRYKTVKNNIVVANGQDANIGANGSLISATRHSSSSEGPTDDLRIKPDIMGNGHDVFSARIASNDAYGLKTGTSMAAPSVCGSLLLLQQHYNNKYGLFMRAATLKGLALHTADDVETNGPDANTGWGYMNTKVAAETITNNGLTSWISEETLNQGETMTFTVQSDGAAPLLASISWTDSATGGFVNAGTANDNTPVLINDLDIRVSQGGNTYHPWKLTGVTTNSNANGTDNTVDPYERVDVNGASGTYTITVTHKGNLYSGKQKFSLIVTGLSSNIALVKKTQDLVVCSTDNATFNFDYNQTSSAGGTTTITTNNVPNGVQVNISQNTFTANGNFNVSFSNLGILPANDYRFEVIATNGNETEVRNVYLKTYKSTFSNIVQNSPANGALGLDTANTLSWNLDANSEEYIVEVATDPNFGTIVRTATVTTNQYVAGGLTRGTVYYWRVRGKNRCATATTAALSSFQVGRLSCNTTTQNNAVNIISEGTATSTLTINGGPNAIGDVNVRVAYNHTWMGDVALTLVSPQGTRVDLIKENTCNDQSSFNIKFDDDSGTINCDTANGGTLVSFRPEEPLSAFIGQNANGDWRLEIKDNGFANSGTVTSWDLELCESANYANPPSFVNNGMNVSVNTSYAVKVGDIEATTNSETAAQQVYTLVSLPTKGNLRLNATNLSIGAQFTQNDINTGKLSYLNSESTAFTTTFKVNIMNAANGWLPNRAVTINAATLNISEFDLNTLTIWPNPAKNSINVTLNDMIHDKVEIQLYDLQGRLIYHRSFEQINGDFTQTISVNDLANGSYIVTVKNGTKRVAKQIIINN